MVINQQNVCRVLNEQDCKPDVVNRINKINKTRVKKTACPEGQEVTVEAESPKDKDKQEEGKKGGSVLPRRLPPLGADTAAETTTAPAKEEETDKAPAVKAAELGQSPAEEAASAVEEEAAAAELGQSPAQSIETPQDNTVSTESILNNLQKAVVPKASEAVKLEAVKLEEDDEEEDDEEKGMKMLNCLHLEKRTRSTRRTRTITSRTRNRRRRRRI